MSERDEFEAWLKSTIGAQADLRFMLLDYSNGFTNDLWQAWQAARATPKQAVPEGWRLVPVEPTESMRLAPAKDRPGFSRNVATEIYRSMLAVAPQPSQEPQKAPQRYQD